MTHTHTLTLVEAAAPVDNSASDPRTLDEALILNRVTNQAWQVCDSRHDPHTPGYLLRFVEQVGDKFWSTGLVDVLSSSPGYAVSTNSIWCWHSQF